MVTLLIAAVFILFVVGFITQITIPGLRDKPMFPLFRRKKIPEKDRIVVIRERLEYARAELESALCSVEIARLEKEIEDLHNEAISIQVRASVARQMPVPERSAVATEEDSHNPKTAQAQAGHKQRE